MRRRARTSSWCKSSSPNTTTKSARFREQERPVVVVASGEDFDSGEHRGRHFVERFALRDRLGDELTEASAPRSDCSRSPLAAATAKMSVASSGSASTSRDHCSLAGERSCVCCATRARARSSTRTPSSARTRPITFAARSRNGSASAPTSARSGAKMKSQRCDERSVFCWGAPVRRGARRFQNVPRRPSVRVRRSSDNRGK